MIAKLKLNIPPIIPMGFMMLTNNRVGKKEIGFAFTACVRNNADDKYQLLVVRYSHRLNLLHVIR